MNRLRRLFSQVIGANLDSINELVTHSSASLVALQGLTPVKKGAASMWRSHSRDPQFYLNLDEPGLLKRKGWLVLEYDFCADKPTHHQLYLNLGDGYQEDIVVSRDVGEKERVQFVFYSPGDLDGLRLDPATALVEFSIEELTLRWSEDVPSGLVDDAPWLTHYFRLEDGEMGLMVEPVNQVRRQLEGEYHWLSEGLDPYFKVMAGKSELALSPGWYDARIHLDFPARRQLARVYFRVDGEFSEESCLTVVTPKNSVSRRLVYLPNGAEAVRLDPQERPGPFRLDGISFSAVSGDEALDECLRRLCDEGQEYSSLSVSTCKEKLAADAVELDLDLSELVHSRYQESFAEPPGVLEYEEWIQAVETPRCPSDKDVNVMLDEMHVTPLVSVLVPVYNPEPEWLRSCIESVLSQSYTNWQLCLADDASPNSAVREVLEEYAAKDSRINVVFRENNGHISEASNSAFEIADGEFVVLMDHDDELAKHALLFVVDALNKNPGAQILYSDEDKIDEAGVRFDPHFKSSWNPELFFAQNYVSHLGVYRASLVQRVGGFRKGLEGSQDQDLLLRCLPFVSDGEIIHIPRVLYHWRSIEGSTARGASEKSYTTEAGLTALRDYLSVHGPKGARVERGKVENTYRVTWPLPEPEPLVSLLIPTRDRRDLVEVAVRSILNKTTYGNFEILILDNGSVESETLEFFSQIQKEDNRVRVERYDFPFNYSAINNYGFSKSRGSIIGLINNDIEVISPEWLTEMVRQAVRPEIGCVGAKLYYGNGQIQHAGVVLGLGGVAGHSHKYFDAQNTGYFHRLVLPQNIAAVTAACLLVRRDVFDEVGGLDEENLTVAFNDVDFCLKVFSAGYKNLWTPFAELYHHESISRGAEDSPEKLKRFQREVEYMRTRWGSLLDADPYYSINLTRDREDFSIGR
ncbi:glycosyltransferase family 2 protein [Marinobacter sp. MBR-105]